jgi:hypothetical protein
MRVSSSRVGVTAVNRLARGSTAGAVVVVGVAGVVVVGATVVLGAPGAVVVVGAAVVVVVVVVVAELAADPPNGAIALADTRAMANSVVIKTFGRCSIDARSYPFGSMMSAARRKALVRRHEHDMTATAPTAIAIARVGRAAPAPTIDQAAGLRASPRAFAARLSRTFDALMRSCLSRRSDLAPLPMPATLPVEGLTGSIVGQ